MRDSVLFTFGQRMQKTPAGPRDAQGLLSMPGSASAPTFSSICEEDEDQDEEMSTGKNQHDVLRRKPAQSLSLEELNAGFGISNVESELQPSMSSASLVAPPSTLVAMARPFVSVQAPLIAEKDSGIAEFQPQARYAIDGATGHASLPITAIPLNDDDSTVPLQSELPFKRLLKSGHEPRRSISAPHLHLLQAQINDLIDSEADPKSPFAQSDKGYVAESRADSDTESASSGTSHKKYDEYSNPSDAERARERRDISRSSTSPLAMRHLPKPSVSSAISAKGLSGGLSPSVSLVNASGSSIHRNSVAERWLDQHESEEIISNPSDEEEILASLGRTDTRQLSWTPSFVGHFDTTSGNVPDNTHATLAAPHCVSASFTSATSSSAKSRPTLNATAPVFVFGGAPHRPANPTNNLVDLNPSAREFKPTFTFRAAAPTLPTEIDNEDPREGSNRDLKRSRMSDGNRAIWLLDVSPDPLSITSSTLSPPLHTPGLSNMQSFKFPSTSAQRPQPVTKPDPLSALAPQLPPLGTIGRNTPLRAAFEALNFAGSPRKGSLPDGFGGLSARSPTRAKAPLPDFASLQLRSAASHCIEASHAKQITAVPAMNLRPDAGHAGGAIAELGNQVLVQSGKVSGDTRIRSGADPKPKVSTSPVMTADVAIDDADQQNIVEYDGPDSLDWVSEEGSVPQSVHAASSYGSDVVGRRHSPGREVNQSWKLFEAILDRKIDALRLDIFSNSTPLPPPLLSAESGDALAASIVDAIRDELPLRGANSGTAGSTTNCDGISRELLTAIHETQDLMSDLSKKSTSSVDAILEMLNQRSSGPGDRASSLSASEAGTLLVEIREAVKISSSDSDILVSKIVDALQPTSSALAELRWGTMLPMSSQRLTCT